MRWSVPIGGLVAAAVMFGVMLVDGSRPASAQQIGQDALSYLGTFAFADSLKTWDQAKEYSAESVLDHVRDGFRASGYRLPGGHMIYPTLQAKTVFDDNLFLTPQKVGDLRSSLGANVELQTSLPRHALKVALGAETTSFKDHSYLDFTNANARVDGRIDVTAADSIGISFQSQLGHDDNFLPVAPDNAAAAVPIWLNRGGVGYMHDAGRTALAIGADYQRTRFSDVLNYDGSTADKAAGDNDIAGAFAFLSYRWSPGYRGFLAGRIDREVLLNERAAYGDNNTYRAEAGVVYELDPLLKFSLYGGYDYIKFDTDAQYNFGTMTFKGQVQWLPTQRLTVTLDAGRSLQRTVVGPEFGQLSDQLRAKAQYDIYHNIIGTLDLSLQRNQFIGSSRVDTQWNAGASVDYLFNENLALTLGYEHIDRASTDSNFSFDDNRFMATLKLSQ